MSTNEADITAKIEQGYASAQRGDLIDAELVREQMADKKRAWLADRNRPD